MLERLDVRLVMGSGTVLAAISLSLIGRVDSIVELYLVYIAFGIGFSASGLLPATTLIARWFDNNRAKALSIASTGLSLGGVLLTPPCAALIEIHGLRATSPWMGAAYLVGVLPVCVLVLRSFPSDIGVDVAHSAGAAGTLGNTLSDALRQPYFWSLAIAYLFVMLAQVGGIAHQYGLVNERMEAGDAAYAIGVLPLFSIVGRLAGGMIIDTVSTWRFTLLMMVLQGFAMATMALASSVPILLVALAVFGVTVGNLLMLQPLLIAESFGIEHYSRIYSWANLLSMLGLASGPALMGFVYTIGASYQYPYLLAAGSGFLACFVFNLVAPRIR